MSIEYEDRSTARRRVASACSGLTVVLTVVHQPHGWRLLCGHGELQFLGCCKKWRPSYPIPSSTNTKDLRWFILSLIFEKHCCRIWPSQHADDPCHLNCKSLEVYPKQGSSETADMYSLPPSIPLQCNRKLTDQDPKISSECAFNFFR